VGIEYQTALAAALKDRGVSISLAEGFVVVPGASLTDDLTSLDVMGNSEPARPQTWDVCRRQC
jgi:hypothetical protein